MLFVFGCKASKIRASKFDKMIHQSEKHGKRSFCKVEIHFQLIIDKNDGTYDVVPNSEFVIGRSANLKSKSSYTINNREVKFKEVSAMLSGYGVDLIYNRFLILQVGFYTHFKISKILKCSLISFRAKLKKFPK
jgi:structural maintenance of chromosome 4